MVVTIIVILGIVISVLAWTLVRVSARREEITMSPEAISAIRNECNRSRVARFIRLQYLGSDPIVMFVSNITGRHLGIPLADFSAASVYHHTHQSDEEFIAAENKKASVAP